MNCACKYTVGYIYKFNKYIIQWWKLLTYFLEVFITSANFHIALINFFAYINGLPQYGVNNGCLPGVEILVLVVSKALVRLFDCLSETSIIW